MKSSFLLLFFSISVLGNVYKPFGGTKTLPTVDTVEIVNDKIGIETQQVCGVTDLTSLKVHIPKRLASGQYWRKVGNRSVKFIKDAAMSYLAPTFEDIICNMSPTVCGKMRHNEMMASVEAFLTKDDCKIMNAASNNTMLTSARYRDCVKNVLKHDKNATPGEAREECIYGGKGIKNVSTVSSQNDNFANSNNASFSKAKFLGILFPETRNHESQGSNGRKNEVISLGRELFPGIEIKGTITLFNVGNIKDNAEVLVSKESKKTESAIHKAIKEIRTQKKRGFDDRAIVRKLKEDGFEKYEALYSKAFISSKNTDIADIDPFIHYETLVSLEREIDDKELATPVNWVVTNLAREKGYYDAITKYSDIKDRAVEVCAGHPDVQDVESQLNCKTLISSINETISSMEMRRRLEKNAIAAQVDAIERLESYQNINLSRQVDYESASWKFGENIKVPLRRE